MGGCSEIGGNAEAHHIGISMRFVPLSLLLILWACNDHKRPNSFDGKPSEKKAAPYNGVPEDEQKR